MPWCPVDRTEYREGFTVCADCGTRLVDVLPPEPVASPDTEPEDSFTGTPIGKYDRIQAPMILELLAEHGIQARTDDPLTMPYLAPESTKFCTVLVQPDRTEEARKVLTEELPGRLEEITVRAEADPVFASSTEEPVRDRDVGPLIPFGWLEPGVARVFMEVMNEEDIASEPEYSLDEPPPPYAREDGRVRLHVEEWFIDAATNLLETRVREMLKHRWIPFKEPLRGEDP